MRDLHECEIVERLLEREDDDSFNALFRVFSPQLVAFFRRRGFEIRTAEDLAQEVMLTVHQKAGQVKDHKLFRAGLFTVARNSAYRLFSRRTRQVPILDVTDIIDFLPAPNPDPAGPTSEFNEWMKFLDAPEREAMTLRFVEDWEYHEIAAVQSIPVGTAKWRVFNSKKKLAAHFSPVCDLNRRAA